MGSIIDAMLEGAKEKKIAKSYYILTKTIIGGTNQEIKVTQEEFIKARASFKRNTWMLTWSYMCKGTTITLEVGNIKTFVETEREVEQMPNIDTETLD